jgi:hypothetical protein
MRRRRRSDDIASSRATDGVAIAEETGRSGLVREGVHDLLGLTRGRLHTGEPEEAISRAKLGPEKTVDPDRTDRRKPYEDRQPDSTVRRAIGGVAVP